MPAVRGIRFGAVPGRVEGLKQSASKADNYSVMFLFIEDRFREIYRIMTINNDTRRFRSLTLSNGFLSTFSTIRPRKIERPNLHEKHIAIAFKFSLPDY
jgi:hypothetical protein